MHLVSFQGVRSVTPEAWGHFYTSISMILDGHTAVEHNIPLANYYDDIVQLMANGRTATTPTVMIAGGALFGENYLYQTTQPWNDPKVKTYVQNTLGYYNPLGGAVGQPPHVRGMLSVHQADELWEIGFRATALALKKLDQAGVLVNAGGHGNIQGLDLHWEMWLLAEGGWDNHRVLRTGTINGATTLGLDGQIGTLEVGKLADLIVLDANPLENIHNTNTVRYTMVNGRLYDSLSMNEIGNYDRPRGKFFWELTDYNGIDWNEAWSGDDKSISGSGPSRVRRSRSAGGRPTPVRLHPRSVGERRQRPIGDERRLPRESQSQCHFLCGVIAVEPTRNVFAGRVGPHWSECLQRAALQESAPVDHSS